MLTRVLLIVFFIIIVSIYLLTSKIVFIEKMIITISLLVLLLSVVSSSGKNVEGFANANDGIGLKSEVITIPDILNTYKKIELEENIADIASGLVYYTTAFNSQSYPSYGKSWINIAPHVSQSINNECNGEKALEGNNNSLLFELNPIYSRKAGFYLGNNRIIGPYSNAFNIQFHNTFTIVLVVKHGNLMVNQKNQEIEFLKLYANSPNNNGITMYIKKGSLTVTNNVQVGNMMFQYADQPPKQCVINKEDSLMHLDKDLLTFYFIVKDIDSIRILYMSEKNNIIYQLLKFNVTNEDITFSNKELIINRMLAWNANIYTFAIYNMAFMDDDVTNFYNHIMGEYIKNVDQSFTKVVSNYNNTLDYIANFTKCPFDKSTCESCSSVASWCDTAQLMASGSSCKRAIDTYCTINPSNSACKCWDTNSPLYNSESCKLYRSIFGSRENVLNYLSADDIEYIKKKYKLMTPEECPKDVVKAPTFANNTYTDYDYDKLKVKLEDSDSHPSSNPKDDDVLDTIASKQYREIERLAQRQQNMNLRIGQTETSRDRQTTEDLPALTKKEFTLNSDKSDSFFNKFIKILVPPSKPST